MGRSHVWQMGRVRHSAALRYCAAGLACGGALAGGLGLAPLTRNAFLLFLAAVALSTWWGGLGPGLLATLAGTAAIDYFFEQPRYSFEVASTSTLLDLAVFVLM